MRVTQKFKYGGDKYWLAGGAEGVKFFMMWDRTIWV